MIERARTVARRVRRWSRGPEDRCAECGGPLPASPARLDGRAFCSQACGWAWQTGEMAP